MARNPARKPQPLTADGPMTAAQEATLKRLAQDAYELDAFKPNLTRTEAEKRIAMLTAKLKLLDGRRIHSETGAASELAQPDCALPYWASITRTLPVTHQPIDRAEREDGCGESQQLENIGARQVEDDQFAYHSQQRDQDDGAYLHDAVTPLGQHQHRALKLKCDDDGENLPNTAWNTA